MHSTSTILILKDHESKFLTHYLSVVRRAIYHCATPKSIYLSFHKALELVYRLQLQSTYNFQQAFTFNIVQAEKIIFAEFCLTKEVYENVGRTQDASKHKKSRTSVTRTGDLLDFGQLTKPLCNNKFAQISHIFRQFL